jgi:hypothetical protein
MGSERHAYRLPDGTAVPSVSAVLQMHKSDYKSPVIEAAAADGDAVHGLVAAELGGGDVPPLATLTPEVRNRFQAFRRWAFDRVVQVEAIEHRMEPLGAPSLAYGGTLDLVAVLDEGRTLIDLKPGRRDYLHFAQLGAYAALWEQHYPDRRLDRGLILHLDSKTGTPSEDWLTRDELELAAWWFAALRSSYHAKEFLKSRFAAKRRDKAA